MNIFIYYLTKIKTLLFKVKSRKSDVIAPSGLKIIRPGKPRRVNCSCCGCGFEAWLRQCTETKFMVNPYTHTHKINCPQCTKVVYLTF